MPAEIPRAGRRRERSSNHALGVMVLKQIFLKEFSIRNPCLPQAGAFRNPHLVCRSSNLEVSKTAP